MRSWCSSVHLDQVNRVDLVAIPETHAVHLIQRHCESESRTRYPEPTAKCQNPKRSNALYIYILYTYTLQISTAHEGLLVGPSPPPCCPHAAMPHARATACGMHMRTASRGQPLPIYFANTVQGAVVRPAPLGARIHEAAPPGCSVLGDGPMT